MSIARITGLLLIFGVIALAVVHLRLEQTRSARRIQRIQTELVEIRRQSWTAQLSIARLKAPRQVESRVEALQLQVAAPYPPEAQEESDHSWAKAP